MNWKISSEGHDKWEELVRRYERSNSSGTPRADLHEDIRKTAFGALVPSELEQLLAMNRPRLNTHEHDSKRRFRLAIEAR